MSGSFYKEFPQKVSYLILQWTLLSSLAYRWRNEHLEQLSGFRGYIPSECKSCDIITQLLNPSPTSFLRAQQRCFALRNITWWTDFLDFQAQERVPLVYTCTRKHVFTAHRGTRTRATSPGVWLLIRTKTGVGKFKLKMLGKCGIKRKWLNFLYQ